MIRDNSDGPIVPEAEAKTQRWKPGNQQMKDRALEVTDRETMMKSGDGVSETRN